MNMFWEAVAAVAHPAGFEAFQGVVTPICDVYMHFFIEPPFAGKGISKSRPPLFHLKA
jgi:hypothetical protein